MVGVEVLSCSETVFGYNFLGRYISWQLGCLLLGWLVCFVGLGWLVGVWLGVYWLIVVVG